MTMFSHGIAHRDICPATIKFNHNFAKNLFPIFLLE